MNRRQLLAQPRPLPIRASDQWACGPVARDEKRPPACPDISDVVTDFYIEHRGRLLLLRRVSDGQILDRKVQ